MKRILAGVAAVLVLAVVVLWAAGELQQSPVSQLPDGALLYIEAKDCGALLKDWNGSEERRVWLAGDNYQAFSRSRLFSRLSQAQDEFSTAAGLPADSSLLTSVAGKQSALAVYDIGNLAFVYVTRMDLHAVEATPLWQLRPRFEQRTEGASQFYVRQDLQSNRTAAFAASNGWLILGTREDLVAGVLDRLQVPNARSLAAEGWFADALQQAPAAQGDLRMVLNLDKLVPSPYFRSYWIQQNITEMKQYSAAVSDLYRAQESDREERVLLRRPGLQAVASEDVGALSALAPPNVVFYSAQGSPTREAVLAALRENLLDLRPAFVESESSAPPPPSYENAGSASMLEARIDQAPVVVKQADPYLSLRTLLRTEQLSALLQAYAKRTSPDSAFIQIEKAIVIQVAQNWDDASVHAAITESLEPGLTAARMGLAWTQRSGASVAYFALDGQVHLYAAVRRKQLFLSTDPALLEQMLARQLKAPQAQQSGITYAAVFRHTPPEQQNFRGLFAPLDWAGHAGSQDGQALPAQGENPVFFSGSIASLSRMFSSVNSESVEEEDQGSWVTQTVV